MRHRLFRRAAKLLVKPGGMCWVMTMAGASAGMGTSTSRMASVPPVEAPMQMTFSVVASRGSGSLGTALAEWELLPGAAAALAGVAARRRTCA